MQKSNKLQKSNLLHIFFLQKSNAPKIKIYIDTKKSSLR